MFAKGPMPGATPKADALALAQLPSGTACKRVTTMGITGYVVILPDGRKIASAGKKQERVEKQEHKQEQKQRRGARVG